MIVPEFDLRKSRDSDIPECLTWFSKLIVIASRDQEDDVSQLIRKWGGRLDMFIEIDGLTSEQGLRLLNEGASQLICSSDVVSQLAPQIPSDRIRMRQETAGAVAHENKDVICDRQFVGVGTVANSWIVRGEDSSHAISRRHEQGIDCAIGIAEIESGLVSEALSMMLNSDRRDALWPTVIVDELGLALGLAYSNPASLHETMRTGQGVYWSRSRNELWHKGATSGATQALISIALDCDSDCLRFTVRQQPPGFCHRNTHTCFGDQRTIQTVLNRLKGRLQGDDSGSYTLKLARDVELLRAKLLEEAGELAEATQPKDVAWETADLIYFALIRMLERGVELDDVFAELTRRLQRVVRRPEKDVQDKRSDS